MPSIDLRDDDWYRARFNDDRARVHTFFVRAESLEDARSAAETHTSHRPITIEHIPEERIRLWRKILGG